jgi:hypothetical protein
VKHVQWTPRETWIEVAFPAIIDVHTFQEAQRRKKHYTIERVGRMDTLSFPLKGILFCGQHQKNYTASYTANRGELNVYRYYECAAGSRYHKEYGKCCLRKPSTEDMEHDAHVWVLQHLLDPTTWSGSVTTSSRNCGKAAVWRLSRKQQRGCGSWRRRKPGLWCPTRRGGALKARRS